MITPSLKIKFVKLTNFNHFFNSLEHFWWYRCLNAHLRASIYLSSIYLTLWSYQSWELLAQSRSLDLNIYSGYFWILRRICFISWFLCSLIGWTQNSLASDWLNAKFPCFWVLIVVLGISDIGNLLDIEWRLNYSVDNQNIERVHLGYWDQTFKINDIQHNSF